MLDSISIGIFFLSSANGFFLMIYALKHKSIKLALVLFVFSVYILIISLQLSEIPLDHYFIWPFLCFSMLCGPVTLLFIEKKVSIIHFIPFLIISVVYNIFLLNYTFIILFELISLFTYLLYFISKKVNLNRNIKSLLALYTIHCISLLLYFITELLFQGFRAFYCAAFYVFYSLILYQLFYQLMLNKSEGLINKSKYKKSGLTKDLKKIYVQKLLTIFIEKKPYLNEKLRLKDLASDLGIKPYHLSQILNEEMKMNFYDFVNQYRVKEVLRLQKQNYPNKDIYYLAGFNNPITYRKSMKKFED